MHREIAESRSLLQEALKWLALVLLGVVEWGLCYWCVFQ
jgi:hypothetical protein